MKKIDFKRPVPLWIFLTGLLIVAIVSTGAFYLPKLLFPPADFQLSLSPSNVYVRPEPVLTSYSTQDANSSKSLLTVRSTNGFSGVVSITASYPTGLSVDVVGPSLLLGIDAAKFGLNVTTEIRVAATTLGDYEVNVVARSGSLAHSSLLTVHSEDVGVDVTPTTLSVVQGASMQYAISYSSLNRFEGNLSLDVNPHYGFFAGGRYNGRWFVNGTLSATSVHVNRGASSSVAFTVSAGDFVEIGNYNFSFTITASLGNWSWRSQVSAKVLLAPEPSLTLSSYSIGSNTSATLSLRNGGAAAIELDLYTVNDTAGDSAGLCLGGLGCPIETIIDPGSIGTISVFTENYFTYQKGQTYTVVVETSRQNWFATK